MKSVRFVAALLHRLAGILSVIFFLVFLYAAVVVLWDEASPGAGAPIAVSADGGFKIFFPFTNKPFLLGDYTASYLVSNLLTLAFYGLFLWLLSGVFGAFRQPRLFTPRGVVQLSRFYLLNLLVPVIFLGLLLVFGSEIIDVVRISLLHLVIGVFAFFMAAIFKQGLVLQEEQDLIF